MSRILVVDDNEQEVRRPLVRQLGRVFGPDSVLEAENGLEAISILPLPAEDRIGVIILDVMMPVMDGIAACQAIRANSICEGVYIIMLTGRDRGLPEGLEAGADVYLRKPCEIEELIAVVNKGLQEFEKYQRRMNKEEQLENRLRQVEEEKERSQCANVFVELPVDMDQPTSWVDITDMIR
ncbi:MAG: response regulator [Magnetococcales bacterium]|nr:response regulator [Magnetococcales bacterium]